MKVEYIEEDCAQVYFIEAAGGSLAEAVHSGLDQACEAVDRIVEVARSGAKTPRIYGYVIDIDLKCPEAEFLGETVLSHWAQAEPNLANVFPLNSLVFWATLAKWPEQDPRIDQKIQAYVARIGAICRATRPCCGIGTWSTGAARSMTRSMNSPWPMALARKSMT